MSWLTIKAECSVSFQSIVLTAAKEISNRLAPLLNCFTHYGFLANILHIETACWRSINFKRFAAISS